ncbi:hypothetical protein [Bradyrhizobium lablabi]|uniref:hypothetical protein n=1 Tax=Bradyrhizobium lablabi TaxID=722472 RepID=UPI001BA98BD3|nr:hypothetical protein [Bradyrhizobium lablabi]MBR0696611.1 hypothetical protein [Bradyrhizobium lablabi]
MLGAKLLAEAIEVDTGLYQRVCFVDGRTSSMVISKDMRQLPQAELTGVDAFLHRADLSNDFLGRDDPNHD